MKTQARKAQKKMRWMASAAPQKQSDGAPTIQHADNQGETIQVKKMRKMMNNSLQPKLLNALQTKTNNSLQVKQLTTFQRIANKSPQAVQLQAMSGSLSESAVQRMVVPYTRKDLGFPDPAATFADETIGLVKYQRPSGMAYSKNDGDDTGSIKHHVPWNWIAVNLKLMIEGKTRKQVYNTLNPIREYLGVSNGGFNPTAGRAQFDCWVESVFEGICDWEENLFKHSVSSGDGGGTKLDVPGDSGVFYRVDVARKKLEYVGLGGKPL